MNIVVLIKAVKPAMVYGNEKRNERYVINPYDQYALVHAVSLKKINSEVNVKVLCMGPRSAEEIIRKAYLFGADEGILISEKSYFAGADTVATTKTISAAIKSLGKIDLIFAGSKAVDGETGQVPYGVSDRIGYNFIDNVIDVEIISDVAVSIRTKNKVIRSRVPLTVIFDQYSVEDPKTNILNIRKSRNKNIKILNLNDLQLSKSDCGISGSKTRVLKALKVDNKRNCQDITSDLHKEAITIMNFIQNVKEVNLNDEYESSISNRFIK